MGDERDQLRERPRAFRRAPRACLEVFGQQVAPPAIPEGDRHRALRLFLPDDVLVQLFNNLRASRRSIARGLAWPAAGTRRGAHLARFERDAGAGCRDLLLDRRHLDEQRVATLPRGADRAREQPRRRLRGPRPAGMAPRVPRSVLCESSTQHNHSARRQHGLTLLRERA